MYRLEDLKDIKLNFHFSMFCNMKCSFCFYYPFIAEAQFKNNLENWLKIIRKVSIFKALNFAGGEPTIYWNALLEMAKLSKELGLKPSLITNGSVILKKSQNDVNALLQYFDSVGISMDSTSPEINEKSGRYSKNDVAMSEADYIDISNKIKNAGSKLKINTVVHSLNKNFKMSDFINKVKPYKWKIMQVSDIGQGGDRSLIITKEDFENFLKINKLEENSECVVSIEDEKTVIESYVMIDGEGKFYYSDQVHNRREIKSLLDDNVDIIEEFNKCGFDLNSQKERYAKEN